MSVMTETASRLGLKDAELLREQCYVDGHWIAADSGKTIEVTDPATGRPRHRAERRARRDPPRDRRRRPRLPAWRAKTAKERATILRRGST